ncbi:MAG: hypothetical protein LCI00_22025 [Chloroflexi bacterium]|nr:hypothetical protein [Chloroflexota bacterium]MCC6895145.1 hypothetical protein [Anaerolineae bacterium]
MRFRRRNTAWLAALTAITSVAIVAGAANPAAIILLVGLLGVALAASFIEVQPRRLREAIPSSPLAMMRMSAQAREASERARRRSSFAPPGINLLDIGLISLVTSSDGSMTMRRGRQISLDDKGVRPYITLNIDPQSADRNATIRFEIIDHTGQTQYVHEMKTFLRDGEMNILADTQLPLLDNDRLPGAGDWDLRVSVDNMTVGLLGFNTTPSLIARSRQFASDHGDDAPTRLQDDTADDSPMTLEDLMRAADKQRQRR